MQPRPRGLRREAENCDHCKYLEFKIINNTEWREETQYEENNSELIKKSDKNPIILNVRVCFSLLQIEYVLLMKQFCVIPDCPMVSRASLCHCVVSGHVGHLPELSLYKTWTTIQTTSSLLIFHMEYWTKYFCKCNRQHIYNCDCTKNEGHFVCDNFYKLHISNKDSRY